MVDEHADQLVADGLVNEGCGNGRVDSARKTTDHAGGANLLTNLGNLLGNNVARVPVGSDAGGVVQEVFENVLAKLRVLDLGVPLHAVDLLLAVGEGCNRGGFGRCENLEPSRCLHDLVAVRHPADLVLRLAGKDLATRLHVKFGGAVFALTGLVDASAKGVGEGLEPVADAENRNPKF